MEGEWLDKVLGMILLKIFLMCFLWYVIYYGGCGWFSFIKFDEICVFWNGSLNEVGEIYFEVLKKI